MPDLKMLNSTKYLYKLTFIKCSYGYPCNRVFMPLFVPYILTAGKTECYDKMT